MWGEMKSRKFTWFTWHTAHSRWGQNPYHAHPGHKCKSRLWSRGEAGPWGVSPDTASEKTQRAEGAPFSHVSDFIPASFPTSEPEEGWAHIYPFALLTILFISHIPLDRSLEFWDSKQNTVTIPPASPKCYEGQREWINVFWKLYKKITCSYSWGLHIHNMVSLKKPWKLKKKSWKLPGAWFSEWFPVPRVIRYPHKQVDLGGSLSNLMVLISCLMRGCPKLCQHIQMAQAESNKGGSACIYSSPKQMSGFTAFLLYVSGAGGKTIK